METKLLLAIESFERMIPKNSPDDLFGRCYEFSSMFHQFLHRRYRLKSSIVRIELTRGELDFETCHEEWADLCGEEGEIEHYAVECQGWIIDWTYRQFNCESAFPVTYPKSRYVDRVQPLDAEWEN
jgi:hypothetical protein